MPAYMVAVCNITNMKPELKEYAEKSAALSAQHGGKYLVRGPYAELYEGDLLEGKSVIVTEYPSMADLKAFIDSDEYAPVKQMRHDFADSTLLIVEGGD